MAAIRPLATNPFEQFRYNLERECPRAAYWLESMIFGIMAQVDDMTEDRALELACKIILKDFKGNKHHAKRQVVQNHIGYSLELSAAGTAGRGTTSANGRNTAGKTARPG